MEIKMKMKTVFGVISLVLVFFIGCESTDDDNVVVGQEVITGDISLAPVFLNISNEQEADPWDIRFYSGDMTYLVGVNTAAGVLAANTGSTDFDTAELPAEGFMGDGPDTTIIGDGWMDPSTYNPTDHSIQGNGAVYFVRTASYEWVKLQIVSGSPAQFTIRYAFMDDGGAFSAETTVTTDYSSETPAYFDFTTNATVEPSDWHLGFSLVPDYAESLNSYMFMPTVLLNMDAGVRMAIVEDTPFDQVTEIPTDGWLEDMAGERHFGYNGDHMILVYHPEPPYNHKVIVENPDLVYVLDTGSGYYKIIFREYNSGIMRFEYAGM